MIFLNNIWRLRIKTLRLGTHKIWTEYIEGLLRYSYFVILMLIKFKNLFNFSKTRILKFPEHFSKYPKHRRAPVQHWLNRKPTYQHVSFLQRSVYYYDRSPRERFKIDRFISTIWCFTDIQLFRQWNRILKSSCNITNYKYL